jgi:hypothetical protein
VSAPENPPAFPHVNERYALSDGMTLRDWIAGQALAGLLASTNYDANPHGFTGDSAKASYAIADAMLAERGCRT